MKLTEKIKNHILLFSGFIIIFIILYMLVCNQTINDAFYISVSTGTFAGADIDENNKTLKFICAIQTLLMYIILIIMFGSNI